MADEQKTDSKKEETKTVETKTDNNNTRNALFILISLLIIVFLIGLALVINRGLNNPNNDNKTLSDSGLINSDTNVPNNSSNTNGNTSGTTGTTTQPLDTSTIPQDGSSTTPPASTDTNTTPTASPTNSADGSVGTAASTQSSDTSNSSVLPTGHSEAGYKKSLSTQTEINMAGYWIPTQYVAGDIPANGGKYTVQLGDTLWWIAAGHYGDPFKWTVIEGANYSQIGFLPNGEHALILPNQIINLP